ncbi:MAG TPA: TonB-dependent receptor, partial [Xanthomonadaceae bacterium]|nr:TonB-dependent receptor [Xanthomonadaceae bacterium]
MHQHPLAAALSRALSCAMLMAASGAAFGQAEDGPAVEAPAADAAPAAKDLDRIVVMPEIAYRNRTPDIAPVLSYDLEYFQRFEPSTVGDMLKRVPSAVFVSDVLEYDGVQLRGLDPGYTQVLI